MTTVVRARFFFVALGFICCACGHPSGETFKGAPIVLISIDTLRSDHLPAYGYTQVATPAIDELRRQGILCERAYSHYPMTLPSHTSILSGLLPPEHGVRDNVGYLFDGDKHPSVARLLKGAGYETGGAVSSYVLRHGTGISSGFDFYEDGIALEGERSLDSVQRPGGVTARLGLDWIRGRAQKPFFFFLHLYEPHTPYEPPEPFKSRYKNPYDGEIATADAIVGDFLAELNRLGIYDRAVILLLSDHGEGLGDHGEQQHGIFLYREALQVPLLLKLPGGRLKGATIAAPVELIDVAPTLLALAGVARPKAWTGTPLLALLPASGRGPAPIRRVYSETFYPRLHLGWSDLASLIDGRFHYIAGPDPELYDLEADPREAANVRERERRAFTSLRDGIKPFERSLTAPRAADQETLQKLASLGYLGGSGAVAGPLPDPKSQKATLADVEAAFHAVEAGQREQAVAIFQRLLAKNPNMEDIWGFLAFSLQKLGRKEEAAAAYEKALQLSNGAPSLALGAASAMFDLGRFDDARKHAELALKSNPAGANEMLAQIALARHDTPGALDFLRRAMAVGSPSASLRRQYALTLSELGRPQEAVAALQPIAGDADPATTNTLAAALSDAGRNQEAEAVLTKLVARRPDNARAHELLGMVALRLERPAEARDHLRRAIALNDKVPSAWNTLGVALYRLEGPEAALAAWEKSLALDPAQYDALLNVGMVAAGAGRRELAARALKQFIATAPPDRFGPDLVKARGLLKEMGG